MRFELILLCTCLGLTIISCNNGSSTPPKPLTREEKIIADLDTLKSVTREGDLVVRLTDDVISQQVKYMNQRDISFSHAGIVVIRDGQKMVCNINPQKPGADTVKYEPIDSFLNTKNNVSCGLYRYDLSQTELNSFISGLNSYHQNGTRFDTRYDLETDSVIYCSEMIYKSLKQATGGRIQMEVYSAPKKMMPALVKFFKGLVSEEDILKRKYLAIDNLYMIEECTQIMKFPLKYFPGQ